MTDTSGMKVFGLMKQRLDYLSERQRILSQNIANANTPKYKARDIQTDFARILSGTTGKMPLAVTNPKHIAPKAPSGDFKISEVETSETKPNGNNIVLEDELMKMQANNVDYQTTTEVYKKMASMLRTALGDTR